MPTQTMSDKITALREVLQELLNTAAEVAWSDCASDRDSEAYNAARAKAEKLLSEA